MSFEQINVTERNGVVTITMSRPEALNAITPDMLAELNQAADNLSSSTRVVVLTGAGRAFSAGVDLKALGDRPITNGCVGDILDLPARAFMEKLEAMPQPVLAKVNGFCFTGALELALACDLMIVAAEAKLGDTHAKWGLRPTWGMSQRLPRAVGRARANELSLTGRTFTGTEAADMGMAHDAVPVAELDAAVDALTATIVENSAGSLAAYKDLFRTAYELGLEDGLKYEAQTVYPIPDTDERLAAFRK